MTTGTWASGKTGREKSEIDAKGIPPFVHPFRALKVQTKESE